jgi:L-methionine (R)-S-oxide reductase
MRTKNPSKSERYELCSKEIINEIKEKTILERMDIICRSLKEKIPYYFWVGFYFPKGENLDLGPSNGPPACSLIPYSGVCGKVAETLEPVIVQDVDKFPGHVVCDPRSKSEIALPVFGSNGKLIAVFDVDSEEIGSFNETDRKWLQRILKEAFSRRISDIAK